MSKVFANTLFVLILFFLLFFIGLPETVWAGAIYCTPQNVEVETNNDFNTKVTISTQGTAIRDGDKLAMDIFNNKERVKQSEEVTVENQTVVFNLGKLIPGTYSYNLFRVETPRSQTLCLGRQDGAIFSVDEKGQGGEITASNNIEFIPSSPTPRDIIFVRVKNLPEDTAYLVAFSRGKEQISQTRPSRCFISDNQEFAFYIEPLEAGYWNVVVSKKAGQPNDDQCQFATGSPLASGTIRISETDIVIPTKPPQKASAKGDPCDDKERGPAFKTAIGCIHTNPTELIKDILTFVIGISGGLAFLMMLLGAFQMLTSAGNPETLNAGKDRLTSAIIGLLFIVFAILLLQIIGVGILSIPGFGKGLPNKFI
ncbi:MAG: pilin [Candidatus Daviesbacteria bacterium]|nr:pilin [Candidatus Daviesbacteria bacterium]